VPTPLNHRWLPLPVVRSIVHPQRDSHQARCNQCHGREEHQSRSRRLTLASLSLAARWTIGRSSIHCSGWFR